MPEPVKFDRYADPENGFGYELAESGEEELIKNWLFQTRAKEKFTFFDVGANRGDWTGYTLSLGRPNIEGHLFEISPVMRKRLYTEFGELPYVHINDFGLSDKEETISYRRYPGAEGLNTLLSEAKFWDALTPGVIEEAQVMAGDDYCEIHDIDHIDFLKIDTEGNEWPVLQGLDRMISSQQIDIIQFEYGYITMELRLYIRDFYQYFEERGYKIGRLSKKGIDWTGYQITDNNYDSCPNWVAFAPAACIN